MRMMLTLSEELYLALHFNEKEATVDLLEPATSQLITAGGLTVELLLNGRLRLDEAQLVVLDSSPTGDNLLDKALQHLQPVTAFNPKDGEWFGAVAQKLPLAAPLLTRLIDKEVIRPSQKRKWFGLSNSTIYPLQGPAIQRRWQQLQIDVLVNGGQPSITDALLLFMTGAWGLYLPADLSRQQRKAAEKGWQTLFGDYLGAYPETEAANPLPGLDAATKLAIGHLTISWATLQAGFVYAEVANQPLTN